MTPGPLIIFVCPVSCLTQDSVGVMVEYGTRPSDEKLMLLACSAPCLTQPSVVFVYFELW